MERRAFLTKALLSAGAIAATSSAALALPSVAPAQPVKKACSGR